MKILTKKRRTRKKIYQIENESKSREKKLLMEQCRCNELEINVNSMKHERKISMIHKERLLLSSAAMEYNMMLIE